MRVFRLKVHAGSRRDELKELGADAYELWVRAEAERNQANAAVLSLLSRHLGVEAKRLRMIKGSRSPNKLVGLLGS
ncbi:MAG: DUF167 domain-containing protein [Elusimicrobia bacterium]|nr:DUF167 domain-containing protein [Elusimicrobiota bacterium]